VLLPTFHAVAVAVVVRVRVVVKDVVTGRAAKEGKGMGGREEEGVVVVMGMGYTLTVWLGILQAYHPQHYSLHHQVWSQTPFRSGYLLPLTSR
jgi:hypothetical protein